MAVALTTSFNPSVYAMVTDALLKVGAIQEDEAPSGAAFNSTLFTMNAIVKKLQADGIHVWTEEEGILFPQVGQARYILGGTNTDNACDAYGYVVTETSAPAAAAATALTLSDVTGIADGFYIGVLQASGVMFWTTVSGAPVGQVVTLAAGLDGAVNNAAQVICYQTKLPRPLKVPNARALMWQGLNETPMDVLSRQEYMDLPNKNNPGNPVRFYYSPRRDTGELYIWNVVRTAGIWAVRFTWYRSIADFLTPENTMDFPQEWALPLMWMTAAEIGTGYGWPAEVRDEVRTMATLMREEIEGWDRDTEPVQFVMGWDGR